MNNLSPNTTVSIVYATFLKIHRSPVYKRVDSCYIMVDFLLNFYERPNTHTVEGCYNAVLFIKIFNMALRWEQNNVNQGQIQYKDDILPI